MRRNEMTKKKAANIIPQLILSIWIVLATVLALPPATFAQNGWTDEGATVRLTEFSDQVLIGATNPFTGPEASLHVIGGARFGHFNGRDWQIHTNAFGELRFSSSPNGPFQTTRVTFGENGRVRFGTAITFSANGRLGIGTSPESELHVIGTTRVIGASRIGHPSGRDWQIHTNSTGRLVFGSSPDGQIATAQITFTRTGSVGIGTSFPESRLHITGEDDASLSSGGFLTMGLVTGINIVMDANEIMARDDGNVSTLHLQADGGIVAIGTNGVSDPSLTTGGALTIGEVGDINIVMDNNEIIARNNGNTSVLHLQSEGGTVAIGGQNIPVPSGVALVVNGTITTDVLTITGGADIAEPFQISTTQNVPVGAVVVIDEKNPGMLKLSQQAYDTRVAGVVSGAGGIRAGLILTQESSTEKRQNVAISGRVYVLADASNGPIQPGDLLTSSNTPGHAIKVDDHTKANGAILGKAMSSLLEGKGLVLMLVSLL